MNLLERLRTVGFWWLGLPRYFRVGVILVPAAALALILVLVLRSASGDEAMATLHPTPYGRISSFPPSGTGSPPLLLDDVRLFYEPGWGALEVGNYLEGRPGVLAGLRSWVGDQEMTLAEVIAGQCFYYRINPKVVLALLELQSGLVDAPQPSTDALDWAMGYQSEDARGLEAQIAWAVKELFRGTRDYAMVSTLTLSNGEMIPLPDGVNLGSYTVMRVVALAGLESDVQRLQGIGENSFVTTYYRLFGQDPRQSLEDLPFPAVEPFLTQPYQGTYEVTSIFDHHYPFLNSDGSLISYLGQDALGLLYDGHDGWDYALDFGVPVLAAADGIVVWVGNSDDKCATAARGAVLDHGNGYRTLYWHLDRLDVLVGQEVAQGEVIGLAGASGCADGPHLHFGMHFLGRETDPEGWCGHGEDPWANHPAGVASTWLWADRFSPCQWPAEATLVDSDSADFQQGGTNWFEGKGGVGGGSLWVPSEPRSGVVPVGNPGSLDGVVESGTWRPDLPQDGRYQVYAFVPYWYNETPDTQAAHYLIHHAEGEDVVVVDQSLYLDRWVYLGTFTFSAGRQGFVYLDNLTDETGFGVWFDAMLWVQEE